MNKIRPRHTKICKVCGMSALNESDYSFLNKNVFENLRAKKQTSRQVTVISYSHVDSYRSSKISSLF